MASPLQSANPCHTLRSQTTKMLELRSRYVSIFPKCPRQTRRSQITNLVAAQVKISQCLQLPQQPSHGQPQRELRTCPGVAKIAVQVQMSQPLALPQCPERFLFQF
eukprot:3931742-Rhodomonas_salina.1